MFTQCSNCHTVFELSADVLRVAGGQVRCGRCGVIFSALARLAEHTADLQDGESAYDMEERADSILESVDETAGGDDSGDTAQDDATAARGMPDDPDMPEYADEEELGGNEVAQLQVLDFTEDDLIDESDDETSDEYADDSRLEFTLPPGELDRVFMESKPGSTRVAGFPFATRPVEHTTVESPSAPAMDAPAMAAPAVDATDMDAPAIDATDVDAPAIHATDVDAPAIDALPLDATSVDGASKDDDGPLPDIEVIRDNRPRRVLSAAEVFDDFPPQASPAPTQHVVVWAGAAVACALLLLGQAVNRHRDALSAQGPLAPLLRVLYSSVGVPLTRTPNLSVYQLRQWGVTEQADAEEAGAVQADAALAGAAPAGATPADAASAGAVPAAVAPATAAVPTLRVRASILNTSASPQPFPLLRVTLANRYGTRIGSREFEPAEYTGNPVARQLSPGEATDAVLSVLDPGKDAEGFEIDVCLHAANKKIACANDAVQKP